MPGVCDVADSTTRRQVRHGQRVFTYDQNATDDQGTDRHDGHRHQHTVGGRVTSKVLR